MTSLVPLLRRAIARILDVAILFLARLYPQPDASFTSGVWRAQPRELTTLHAPIDGKLPSSLSGMFVTVGPNPLRFPLGGHHLFEGDGAIVCVRLHNGNASFAYTHLATAKLVADCARGYSNSVSFTAIGVTSLPLRILCALRSVVAGEKHAPSLANTNILQHAGRILALCENDLPYELRPSADGCRLNCVEQIDIPFKGPFSAHPVRHSSGRLFSVGYDVRSSKRDVAVVVLNDDASLQRVVSLRLGRKPMIHDAAITQRYLLIFDFPLLIDVRGFMAGKQLISFRKNEACRVGLMPVDAVNEEQIQWFNIKPCFAFHTIAAWDTPRGVVLYLAQMETMQIQAVFDTAPSRITRYEFDIIDGTCQSECESVKIGDYECLSLDFPVVNDKYVHKGNTFVYLSIFSKTDSLTELRVIGVAKFNLRSRKMEATLMLSCNGHQALAIGEVKFVAKEDEDGDEDDGYLMAYLRDEAGDIRMSIYDAKTMSDIAIASVHAPKAFHVPNGFHSEFISHSALQNAVVSA